MNTTQITIAIAAIATTVTLFAGVAALANKVQSDAYAGMATTTYVADATKTTVVVTRTA